MASAREPIVYGKYQLIELIARGGMAEVWKAKSYGVEGFEKLLVIKRILDHLSADPDFVEMFINEAKIAVSLSHANIVQVFDLGQIEDSYYIAMEYVHGLDLADLLVRLRRAGGSLGVERSVHLMAEVAKGLDYAHRRRDERMQPLHIVHRDVSPQNVLLSFEGEVKLTDFGIAKARSQAMRQTAAGTIKGKFAYMPPEQARSEDVDGRGDIYSLGVVLYELLAGKNPFPGNSFEVMQRAQKGDCAPLAEAVPDVPAELARIVTTAMQVDRDQRYPNAGRLYEDLVAFLYTSGRRVGPEELAECIDAVRAAPRTDDEEDQKLKDALERGGGGATPGEPVRAATAIEVPRRATPAADQRARPAEVPADPPVDEPPIEVDDSQLLQQRSNVGPTPATSEPPTLSRRTVSEERSDRAREPVPTGARGGMRGTRRATPSQTGGATRGPQRPEAAGVESEAVAPGDEEPPPSTAAVGVRERREITLLAVEVGPAGLTDAAVAAMAPILARYAGEVVERSEHGVLAGFGLAELDGRDTETAMRCAPKLARAAASAMGQDAPPFGIGVHAAEVILAGGRIVSDEQLEQAAGDARTLAAAAQKGLGLLASGSAERACRDLFRFAAVSEAAGAFEVVGERTRSELWGRFVGRREELRRMGELLALSNRGEARVVGVAADAGCGKTRFLYEVGRRLDAGGHDVGWYMTECAPQERQVPFAAVVRMLRAILGIDETDPEALVREKIERLRSLGLSLAEMNAAALVLGLEGALTEEPMRALRTAVVKVGQKLALDRLTVFAWDAAQWMDDESQALVDALLRDAARSKLTVCLAYRTGFVHPFADHPGCAEIVLANLSDADARVLIASRLDVDEAASVPETLAADVLRKSAANPLYLEEYVKAMRDAGAIEVNEGRVRYHSDIAEVGLPKTLRGLAALRVSRLSAAERAILQVAAVIGMRFNVDLVADVTGLDATGLTALLDGLFARGAVQRLSPSEYGFTYELVREVVYDGMSLGDRKRMHGLLAASIERLYADRVDEHLERLAIHSRESGDRARAVGYLERLAERLAAEYSLEGAIPHLLRAIELAQLPPDVDTSRLLRLYRRLGQVCQRAGALDLGVEKLELGIELSEQSGDVRAQAELLALRGLLLARVPRIAEALNHLERALDLAAGIDDVRVRRRLLSNMGEVLSHNCEHARSAKYLEEAVALDDPEDDPVRAAKDQMLLAQVYAAAQMRREAEQWIESAAEIVDRLDDRHLSCELEKNRSLAAYWLGDPAGAILAADRALEMAKEYEFHYEAAVNAHNLGDSFVRLGDYKKAFAMLSYSHEVSVAHGFDKLREIDETLLGFIEAVGFASDVGFARVESGVRYAEQKGSLWDLIQARILLGRACRERGMLERAEIELRQALRLAHELGNALYIQDCESLLAPAAS